MRGDVTLMKVHERVHYCTKSKCDNPAMWWVRVREDGIDVLIARCDLHKEVKS